MTDNRPRGGKPGGFCLGIVLGVTIGGVGFLIWLFQAMKRP